MAKKTTTVANGKDTAKFIQITQTQKALETEISSLQAQIQYLKMECDA